MARVALVRQCGIQFQPRGSGGVVDIDYIILQIINRRSEVKGRAGVVLHGFRHRFGAAGGKGICKPAERGKVRLDALLQIGQDFLGILKRKFRDSTEGDGGTSCLFPIGFHQSLEVLIAALELVRKHGLYFLRRAEAAGVVPEKVRGGRAPPEGSSHKPP